MERVAKDSNFESLEDELVYFKQFREEKKELAKEVSKLNSLQECYEYFDNAIAIDENYVDLNYGVGTYTIFLKDNELVLGDSFELHVDSKFKRFTDDMGCYMLAGGIGIEYISNRIAELNYLIAKRDLRKHKKTI